MSSEKLSIVKLMKYSIQKTPFQVSIISFCNQKFKKITGL